MKSSYTEVTPEQAALIAQSIFNATRAVTEARDSNPDAYCYVEVGVSKMGTRIVLRIGKTEDGSTPRGVRECG